MNDKTQSPQSDLEADLLDVLHKYIEQRATVSELDAADVLRRIAARLENDQRDWEHDVSELVKSVMQEWKDFDPNC